MHGLTVDECTQRCDGDDACDCVTYEADGTTGDCWKRSDCVPALFEADDAAAPCAAARPPRYILQQLPPRAVRDAPILTMRRAFVSARYAVYVKNSSLAPSAAGGALAYLKHDAMGPRGAAALMLFNPGAAQVI